MTLLMGGDAESRVEEEEEEEEQEDPASASKLTWKYVDSLTQVKLKEECKKRGLPIHGTVPVPKERLWEGRETKVGAPKQKRKDNPMNGLPKEAYWKLLEPAPEPILLPKNSNFGLRPLTDQDAKQVNPRLGYAEVFPRQPFTGTT